MPMACMVSLTCHAALLTYQDVQVNAFDGLAALKGFLKVVRGCIKVCGCVHLQDCMQDVKCVLCTCA